MARKVAKSSPPKKRTTQKKVVKQASPADDLDPRQALFLSLYLDPKSPTFSNAMQSAISAGFSTQYADNIMHLMPDWLSGAIGQMGRGSLLAKSERNLHEFVDLETLVPAMGAFGPIMRKEKVRVEDGVYRNGNPKFKTIVQETPVMVTSTKMIELKQKSTHFVAETIGKAYYSKALPNSGGAAFFTQINNIVNQGRKDYE